ncbi:MAG: TolC family protein [Leptospiraceae bacterium]|nr:TolC family protein [Leptospiraceae bacterium]
MMKKAPKKMMTEKAKNMTFKTIFHALILGTLSSIFITSPLSAEKTLDEKINSLSENEKPKEAKKVTLKSIEQVVKLAVENSAKIRSARYELMRSDSEYLKSQSQYSWRVLGNLDAQKQKLPFNQANIFSGTKTSTDTISAGIDKRFETGTYVKLEASTMRFDSNAFENASTTPAAFSALAIGPLYTGKLTATLSQDLLKNAFGYLERDNQKILKYQSEIKKQELSYQVSSMVVNTMIEYWQYLIADASLQTYERLLKNTNDIRNLTRRKMGLGLAESFEINQWNAMVSQAQSQVEQSKLERDKARKALMRTLNITEDSEISKLSDLEDKLPSGLNYETDRDYAFEHRADWKSIQIQKEMSDMGLSMAKNNALPVLRATASYSSQGQNLESPQKNFTDSNRGIPSTKYPTVVGKLEFMYPLSDPGVKAGVRDAYIQKKQVSIMELDKKREIEDDIQTRLDALSTSHKVLLNSVETRKSTEAYYYGLYSSFRRGRFTAVTVKNALDSLVQNELGETQAKINFNIELLRYELAKNSIFEKFGIDINKLIEE